MILGIDEVGRGPWAGPLVVGAVILGNNYDWSDLTDSKKLTAQKRQSLNSIILKNALAAATGWVSTEELDRYGLSASLKLATRRAVKQILAQKSTFDQFPETEKANFEIIIDGTVNFLTDTPLADRVSTLVKGDLLVKEISAASIIAKVARDDYMIRLEKQYPGYGFDSHMGYGTLKHRNALKELGVCPEHRRLVKPIRELCTPEEVEKRCKKYNTKNGKITDRCCKNYNNNLTAKTVKNALNSTQTGQKAEQKTADYLKAQNHTIIEQNFKTKFCEIDLISCNQQRIYFTEVKYSANPVTEGTAFARITLTKQQKMRFAAEYYLKTHPEFKPLQPILAAAAVHGANFQVEDWIELDI